MMLGPKGLLPPLILDCSALCAPAIFKNIQNNDHFSITMPSSATGTLLTGFFRTSRYFRACT